MKEVLLVLDCEGLLRQGLEQWQGIDLRKFTNIFYDAGYKIKIVNYDEIINKVKLGNIKNKNIIYTSSQRLEYKAYIDDILFELSFNNSLIPKYEIFKAHENKTYQEFYKERIGLKSLKSFSFGCLMDIYNYEKDLNFPIVFKFLNGAGSSGVSLVENFVELEKIIKNNKKIRFEHKSLLKKLIKKHMVPSKYNSDYYEYIEANTKRYLLQEFVPDLEEDWKVLIFSDKYYVLNRKIRENDFRASGSGKLEYIEPPEEVLYFAKDCFKKLDVPFASLDICMDKNKECYLIEYQGVHFGPYTLINSEWYYKYDKSCFIKKDEKSDLAIEYAKSYIKYLER